MNAQVISVNPGIKTLGELHHPQAFVSSVQSHVKAAGTMVHRRPWLLTVALFLAKMMY